MQEETENEGWVVQLCECYEHECHSKVRKESGGKEKYVGIYREHRPVRCEKMLILEKLFSVESCKIRWS